MNYHNNAKLTEQSRELLVKRVLDGAPVVVVAKMLGVSRTTAYKWLNRAKDGDRLVDRSSRPNSMPKKIDSEVEKAVVKIRNEEYLSPLKLAKRTGVPARTCARIVKRNGCVRISDVDRVTGEIRQRGPVTKIRYEKQFPGELIHMDVKKIQGIPDGGGWRANGERNRKKGRPPKSCLHVAIDDYSRIVYAEQLPNEKKETVAAFTLRAINFFESLGMNVQGFLTDNGPAYRSHLLAETLDSLDIKHKFTKPYHPWTNGKVERFNRTIGDEWQYGRAWRSEKERKDALDDYIKYYNYERPHCALAGRSPMTRLKV